MFLKEIKLNNFMCFKGEHVLSFPKDQNVFGILGNTQGDSNKSNRVGKTVSIVDSILYNLYGSTNRPHQSLMEIGSYDSSFYEVSIEYYLDKNTIRLSRGRENKTSFYRINDKDFKENEYNEYVQSKLTGVSFKDFINTICLTQGDFEGLFGQTPSNVRDTFLRWWNLSKWSDYSKKAKAEKESLESKRLLIGSSFSHRSLKDLEKRKELVEKSILELSEARNRLNDQLKEASKKSEWQKDLERIKETFEDVTTLLFSKPFPHTSDYKIQTHETLLKEIGQLKKDHITFLQHLSEDDLKIKELKSYLTKIQECNGVCPLLQKECNRIDTRYQIPKIKKGLDFYLKNLDKNNEELTLVETQLKRKQDLEKSIIDWKNSALKLLKSKSSENLTKKLQEKRKDLKRQIDKLNLLLQKSKKRSLSEIEEDLECVDNDKNKLIEEKGKIIQEISLLKKNDTVTLDKQILSYKHLQKAFLKVPYKLLSSLLVSLETRSNELLEFFIPEARIKIETEGSSLYVKVIDNRGRDLLYQQDSGGGRFLIGFVLRLVVLEHLKKYRGYSPDFLVLDEPFGCLDDFRRETLFDFLSGKLIQDFHPFTQIFVISHIELRERFDKFILVTKEEDRSTLKTIGF